MKDTNKYFNTEKIIIQSEFILSDNTIIIFYLNGNFEYSKLFLLMLKKAKVRLYEISKYDDINHILKYSPKTNYRSFKKFMESYYRQELLKLK